LTIRISDVASVAHQPASLGIFTPRAALFGIIYASIRNATLFLRLLIARLAWSGDIQFLEHKRVWADPATDIETEIAYTDVSMSRVLVNYYIAGTFIGLQYLVCLLYVFSNLPMMLNTE
jgi:hypothetical protein